MLLLWIIGHRLSADQVGKLISVAVGDALKVVDAGSQGLELELAQLDSVGRVLLSLQKMIKTKLPLPPGETIEIYVAKCITHPFS